ncbi:MAG: hypothetical protein J6U77_05470, partial [Verrucomicrobia bacterium]|nr:hypothetical protein [Verrucomicrobiota bacterium]
MMNLEKHAGKANIAGRRMLWKVIILVFALIAGGVIAKAVGSFLVAITGVVIFLWILLSGFILYFFRDPT